VKTQHASPFDALRPVRSLIAADLASLRGAGFSRIDSHAWGADTPIGPGGIGADSIELVGLAASVADAFGLREIGAEDALLRDRTLGGWAQIVQHAATSDPTPPLEFRTSGTTGSAKAVRHEPADLWAEARVFARRASDRSRVIAALPSHHIYGFIHTVLMPAAAGLPAVDAEFALPSSLLRRLEPGDLIVATPMVWQRLADARASLPANIHGVTSGAPMPPDLWRTLQGRGLDQLTEVYGSTETAGIALRTAPDAPFGLLDRWTKTGEGIIADAAREHDLPDNLDWIDGRRFSVRGRRDGMIQIGGVNVDPRAVATTIESHPSIDRCVVRPTGTDARARLKALVVPPPGIDETTLRSDLHAWCAAHLPAPQRPVSFTPAREIPVGPTGKPCDWDETGRPLAA